MTQRLQSYINIIGIREFYSIFLFDVGHVSA
jgi:hypothetical protein